MKRFSGGFLDLALVAVVVGACWSRTPAGGLADRAWDAVTERQRALPSLASYFVTGPPPEIADIAQAVITERAAPDPSPVATPQVGPGGFPEPWRTAAVHAIQQPAEETLARLDALHAGDPALTLEVYALGTEQVARAVRRARSAGARTPERYESHRRYLSAEDARRADAVVTGTLALATVLDLDWPVAPGFRVSSSYGERIDPVTGKRSFHNGLDLAVPVGTPVLAPRDGAVSAATEDGISGRYLVLDHGYGVLTSFCHLDQHTVSGGQAVVSRQEIGRSGNTGKSTGPHLHYVVRVGGRTVDPARLRAL